MWFCVASDKGNQLLPMREARPLATADPRLLLLTILKEISGQIVSLRVTLAKCDSRVHRASSPMKLRTVTVNYIPDCFKEGIFFKMILEVYVSLLANGNFSNVPKHEILDSWPSRSRNSISSLGIVFDCKRGHSDVFEDLPDCFKEGISPTTSSLRKIWRVWSSDGKEKQRDSHQFPSDGRIWQGLSTDRWIFVQKWFLFTLTRSKSPK